ELDAPPGERAVGHRKGECVAADLATVELQPDAGAPVAERVAEPVEHRTEPALADLGGPCQDLRRQADRRDLEKRPAARLADVDGPWLALGEDARGGLQLQRDPEAACDVHRR